MDNDICVGVYELLSNYGYSLMDIYKVINDKSSFDYDRDKLVLMIGNSYKYLLGKGYTYDEIKRVSLSYPGNLYISDSKRKEIENIFLELGMSFEEFKNFSLKCVNIYAYSSDRIYNYINFFRGLGYDDQYIVKFFKRVPIIFRSSVNNLNKLYNDMIDYSFSKEDVFKIGKNFLSFWTHNFNKIMVVIDIFMSIGFKKMDVIEIIKLSPSLIGYDKNTITGKFDELIKLGFSKKEIMDIVCVYPTIMTSNIDRTKNILEFFTEIGLYNKLLDDPKSFFMQAIESSYAKYCYYIDNNIVINEDTYRRLFLDWKRFCDWYDISKSDLLEKYNYDEYKSNLKKR